jgi:NAD(P)-dependent dehydrogenase (short-subunit alcohol dehydrogenase family)
MKYAYVTGTDRGLGLALAENLLKRGFTLFSGEYGLTEKGQQAGIHVAGMESLAEKYEDRLIRLPLNCGSTASVREAASIIKANTDSLDLLVCNGAILGDTRKTIFDDLTENDFNMINEVYNVNTTGTLRVISSVIHLLRTEGESQANLVIISSEASQIPQKWRTAWFGYCQSKAAVNSLGSLVHNSLEDKNIPVLLFHPGYVRTYMEGKGKNMKADLEPEESAQGILEFVLERNQEMFGFFSHRGEPMEW